MTTTTRAALTTEDTVSSRELASLIHQALTRRGLSIRQFEAMCLERYRNDPQAPYPGQIRQTMSQLGRNPRCRVSTADRLLVALGMNLHDLPSYRALPAPVAPEDILQIPGVPPCP